LAGAGVATVITTSIRRRGRNDSRLLGGGRRLDRSRGSSSRLWRRRLGRTRSLGRRRTRVHLHPITGRSEPLADDLDEAIFLRLAEAYLNGLAVDTERDEGVRQFTAGSDPANAVAGVTVVADAVAVGVRRLVRIVREGILIVRNAIAV